MSFISLLFCYTYIVSAQKSRACFRLCKACVRPGRRRSRFGRGKGASLGPKPRRSAAQCAGIIRMHCCWEVFAVPQAKKPDRLRYAANLAAVSAMLCIALTWGLRWVAGLTLRLLHAGATLTNPVGIPEWVMGLWNIVLGRGRRAGGLFLCARIGERQPNGRQGGRLLCRATAPCGFCCPAFWASAWR